VQNHIHLAAGKDEAAEHAAKDDEEADAIEHGWGEVLNRRLRSLSIIGDAPMGGAAGSEFWVSTATPACGI
jgi:hypothetical protein